MTATPTPARPRYAALDVARGIAIVAMVAYHVCWDLWYYGVIGAEVGTDAGWVAFARTVLSVFIFVAGVSLYLAHPDGIRWRAFRRRFAVLCAAAAAISLGTFLVFGPALVYFGVLHAIALFSLMALPFLRARLVIVIGVALVFLVLPRVVRFEAFNAPWLSWIGFWTVPPQTADLVPIFPWFGVSLLGIAAARVTLASGWRERLARMTAESGPKRWLAVAGRWSLIIYLVHQPLLMGALYPLSLLDQQSPEERDIAFLGSCESSCLGTGNDADFCQRYCVCALETAEEEDLWAALANGSRSEEEEASVAMMSQMCTALSQ